MIDARYFATEGELWDWYRWESEGQSEVWLGLYKKVSRIPSITIRHAMDAALCFGWSESKWQTIDQQRFCIRFTPRLQKTAWTLVAAKRFAELDAAGMIQDGGRRAWERRDIATTERMVLASEATTFPPEQQKILDHQPELLAYWNACAPTYRKAVLRWVWRPTNPKLVQKRFQEFVDSSMKGEELKLR